MQKRIDKIISSKSFVKVHLEDDEGQSIEYVQGIILSQTSDLILMSDTFDFHYDGFTVIRKRDISKFDVSDKERFFKTILDKEGLTTEVIKRYKQVGVRLSDMSDVLEQLRKKGLPTIIECKYGKSDIFQIGPILEVTKKRVRLDHFSATGVFDAKPVISKLKDITLIQFDSPYANTMFKYAKHEA